MKGEVGEMGMKGENGTEGRAGVPGEMVRISHSDSPQQP